MIFQEVVHSIRTGETGCDEQLASAGFLDGDIAFTCGMMHDIGRLALAVVQPKESTGLLHEHFGPPERILGAERQAFGRGHCEIERQLVADSKLPEVFEPIVAGHHAPRKPCAPWDMAELIHISCRMAGGGLCRIPRMPGRLICRACTDASHPRAWAFLSRYRDTDC